MASVGESVNTNKRKSDGQQESQEQAGKSKKKKYSFIQILWLYEVGEYSR